MKNHLPNIIKLIGLLINLHVYISKDWSLAFYGCMIIIMGFVLEKYK